MMTMPRITIVGLGLIGGSIGLALQKSKTNFEIMGHDREHSIARTAQKLGAIDRANWNLISACEHADLIILAIPASGIKDTLSAIAPYLKEGCIITDTATTKEAVLQWADDILPGTVSFIGGDPLVGKEESGIDAATADLFANATYCLMPSVKAEPKAVQLVTDLVALLGAKPYFVDATEHDGLMAGVGHMPFILAAALLDTAKQSPSWRELKRMASHDFQAATRFTSDDPQHYRDLCLANQENIIQWIDACQKSLTRVRQTLGSGNGEEIEGLFAASMAARDEWLRGDENHELSDALDEARRSTSLRSLLFGSRV